jgi:predicted O-linked N-acetylglucosamine transferase (SPINDLY family)
MLASLLRRIFGESQSRKGSWLERATSLQQSGQYDEAAAICRSRLERNPDDVDALQALAAASLAHGRTEEGLDALRKSAALRRHDGQPFGTLGRVCAALGHVDEAIEAYGKAIALRPELHESADELVHLLKAVGQYDRAEDVCRQAIASGGDSAQRRHALAGVLFEQGRVEEAIAALEASLERAPDAASVHSDVLRALNYADGTAPQTVFEAHKAWGRRHADPLSAVAAAHENDPDARRRLRVGYVSPYFRKHAVTFFFESVVEHHDRDGFELVLYADVPRPDEYSERLKAHGAKWRSTVGHDDTALAQMVRDDRIDILVDLSGHTPGNRLLAFARRPAPIQVTWNGYPNTTGMRAIDYRVSDALCDPPGRTEHLNTETLVRLPSVFMSWRPPQDAPDPRSPPCDARGHITFASFNACYKITPTSVALWSRILREVPGSRLVLFTIPPGRSEQRLRSLFLAQGIADDRVETRERMTHEAFLSAHQEIDIALDSFPYHGTTTTCFSLWMGVPVISLVGPTHVSRVGLSLLASIGLADLAAESADGYIATAVALANAPEKLASLRGGLRTQMLRSPLTNGAECAKALEDAYRALWANWCAER